MKYAINALSAELNPICHLLALLGAHHIIHVSSLFFFKVDVKVLTGFFWQRRGSAGCLRCSIMNIGDSDDDDDDDDDGDSNIHHDSEIKLQLMNTNKKLRCLQLLGCPLSFLQFVHFQHLHSEGRILFYVSQSSRSLPLGPKSHSFFEAPSEYDVNLKYIRDFCLRIYRVFPMTTRS